MFEGFTSRRIDTGDVEINLLSGGSGKPLLLLHGYPQTHVIWHKWTTDMRGKGLDCGHFLPEEAPQETAAELVNFFSE